MQKQLKERPPPSLADLSGAPPMGPFSGDHGNSIRNWLEKSGMRTLNSAIKSGLTVLSISEHLPLRLGWRLKWHRCYQELECC